MVGGLRVGKLDDGRVVLLPNVEGPDTSARRRHRAHLGEVGGRRKVPDHHPDAPDGLNSPDGRRSFRRRRRQRDLRQIRRRLVRNNEARGRCKRRCVRRRRCEV